ncbi:MAG: vitamin K epoxide reductase family protein [Deltaproteobacteria bacterium]
MHDPMHDPMALDDDELPPAFRKRRGGVAGGRVWLWVTAAAALFGAILAGVSTADFISHLDRQVHSIHCSFIPGAGAQIGDSGCRTVMMSPYSSLFRDSMWGGLPISVLALAVFAYLVYRAVDLALAEDVDKRHTVFLLAATALPVLMSIIYGYISMSVIGTVCKVCAGIYVCSGVLLVGAFLAHRNAGQPTQWAHGGMGGTYARWFGEGVAYVGLLTVLYIGLAPVSEKSLEGCGTLVTTEDKSNVMIEMGTRGGDKAIAVLDPLCPACKGFDNRMEASGLMKKLDLDVVLFPLDSKCNWMVKESLHPGACLVSQAMLCDKDAAPKILAWAFEHQQELLEAAKKDENNVKRRLREQFPSVASCVGTAKAKNKVNKSLRWAVKNALPVLTPQLFVNGKRVCDEDTDLGLEFTVTKMLEGGRR